MLINDHKFLPLFQHRLRMGLNAHDELQENRTKVNVSIDEKLQDVFFEQWTIFRKISIVKKVK